jgi:type VI secretion system protein ImpA
MAGHNFEALFVPISPDNPCGVDLEMEGDAEFMRFQAQIEGILPVSFLSFDRKEAALGGHIAKASALLKRSADLRTACALAKLAILDGDLHGFSVCLAGIARWVTEQWPGLYPSLIDSDPVLRLIELRSLDDNPHTVLPLQSAPLFKSRRLGAISLRSYLLAEGAVQPRSGFDDDDNAERVPTAAELTGSIRDVDIADIMAMRGHANQLAEAVDAMEAAVDAQSGEPGAFRLEALRATIRQLVQAVNKAAAIKDPSLAVVADADAVQDDEGTDPDAGGVAAGDAGAVTSTRAMTDALRASAAYFARHEPSSPVRLLLVQAEALIGKGFFEALSVLAPEMAGHANIRPARGLALTFPLERLAQLLPEPEEASEDGDANDSWGTDEAAEEPVSDDETDNAQAGGGDDAEDAAEDDTGPGEAAMAADGRSGAGGPPGSVSHGAAAAPLIIARNRREALLLLDNVAAFLRQTEPSSPIPFILDHVKSLAGRDFVTLLRDLLPANVLSVDEE